MLYLTTILIQLIPQILCLSFQRKTLTQILFFRLATHIHYHHFILFTLQSLCSYSYTGKTLLAEPPSGGSVYASVKILGFACFKKKGKKKRKTKRQTELTKALFCYNTLEYVLWYILEKRYVCTSTVFVIYFHMHRK